MLQDLDEEEANFLNFASDAKESNQVSSNSIE